MTWDTAFKTLETAGPLTTVLSMLAAVFAASSAWLSFRLARSIRNELKSDEILVAGVLHNPDLVNLDHRQSVLQTTLFNKSKRKAFVSKVEMFDSKGQEVVVAWADTINAFGNPMGGAELLGIVDSKELCIRRSDGAPVREVVVKVHHSHPGSPLLLEFGMGPGWDSWASR